MIGLYEGCKKVLREEAMLEKDIFEVDIFDSCSVNLLQNQWVWKNKSSR